MSRSPACVAVRQQDRLYVVTPAMKAALADKPLTAHGNGWLGASGRVYPFSVIHALKRRRLLGAGDGHAA